MSEDQVFLVRRAWNSEFVKKRSRYLADIDAGNQGISAA